MDVDRKHLVYLATNIANGHRYVGMTSLGVERRRIAHFSKSVGKEAGGSRFYAALRKYGRDAFVWSVLEVFDTRLKALLGELRYISAVSYTHLTLPTNREV